MAHTAISDPELVKERFDSPQELSRKVDVLVDLIHASTYMTAFTGAGISTSAGIPDFRGPSGKWTREAQGLKPKRGISSSAAVPTPTHMALVQLQQEGILKHLTSQNCDGLHRRSGFPSSALSELHGNSNLEECESCGQQYLRDFRCHRKARSRDHGTGRACSRDSCGGRLLEYTIDFGQQLPEKPLKKAYAAARASDLCLTLGSSLSVSPANDMPRIAGQRGGLVIVNLQKTEMTALAALHIYAKTDTVMTMVMDRLGFRIPRFRLCRNLAIRGEQGPDGTVAVSVEGLDRDDPTLPVELFRHVLFEECSMKPAFAA